jgi:hypothetical protein
MNLHTIREITYGTIFFRLFLSIVIGGVLGLERGRKSRPAGLRTYILVCLGSTVVMMTNQYVSQCMNTGDPVRMGAQVLSGIGFIGAGSIKDNTLKGVNGGKAIDLYLLDNCTISGNTIEGFERPIVANSCDEQFISDTDIVTE